MEMYDVIELTRDQQEEDEMGVQIEYVEGDLIQMTKDGHFDVVAHGCNCFHAMGSGIAPKLNELTDGYLLIADKQTRYGDINKLGNISMTHVKFPRLGRAVYVVNVYTQYVFGGQFRQTNMARKNESVFVQWDAFEKGLRRILTLMGPNMVLGIPLIGCGLAGGSRADFEGVLTRLQMDDTLQGKIVVVEYNG